jgi:hypothetical protein
MMKHKPSDPSVDALVVEARQAYRKVLARHGLLTFTPYEVARARAVMESRGDLRIAPDDIRFQASIARLRSRNLSCQAVDDAVKELIDAERECDQAMWERDCHRASLMVHLHFGRPGRVAGGPTGASLKH